jgi:hypothetical protein
LFAAIDVGVRQTVNANVPPSLSAGLRVRLAETSLAPGGRAQTLDWRYGVAAAVIVILALLPLAQTRKSLTNSGTRSEVVVAAAPQRVPQVPRQSAQVGATVAGLQPRRPWSTKAPTQASRQLDAEILISRKEQKGFAILVSRAMAPESGERTASNYASTEKTELLTIAPLQIARVELRALEDDLDQAKRYGE